MNEAAQTLVSDVVARDAPVSDRDSYPATVVITTKNRKEELCRAIESSLGQTVTAEVLVLDDGSTDGTADFVRERFPSVRVERRAESRGLIVRRNEAARLARGEYVFSLDDDAVFSADDVVERTLADFEADPRIAAVAIGCIDVLKSDELRQPLPDRSSVYVASEYIGTAHAVRRDVFIALGGYREELVHQGEERDFCLRLLDAGFLVRLGTAAPIHHFESPKRDLRRQDFFGRRNDVLFAWQNAPWRALPVHLIATTFNGLRFGVKCGRPVRMATGLARGYFDAVRLFRSRKPVSRCSYALVREMRRRSSMTLGEAIERLEPAPGKASEGTT